MKRITDIITISELSRLINISRPTLYKYIEDFENNRFGGISYDYVLLFQFIVNDNTISKKQIYDYCANTFRVTSDKVILEKLKMKMEEDNDYKDTISLLVNNMDKIDIKELNEYINNKLGENK